MDASSSTPAEVPQLDLNAAILETQSQADAERTKKAYAPSMKRLQRHLVKRDAYSPWIFKKEALNLE